MILYRYLIRELLLAFLLCLSISVLIFWAINMLSVTEVVLKNRGDIYYLGKFSIYILPSILRIVWPGITLLSMLIILNRITAENETVAFYCAGIGPNLLIRPILMVSFLLAFLSFLIGLYGRPWGKRHFKDGLFNLVNNKIDFLLHEKRFLIPFPNITFYIDSYDPKRGIMKEVFIYDERDPYLSQTIVAQRGSINKIPHIRLTSINLESGNIYITDQRQQSIKIMKFKRYILNLSLSDMVKEVREREVGPDELTLKELLALLKKIKEKNPLYYESLIELNEKFSIPICVFFMGLISLPLGLMRMQKQGSSGMIIGVGIFIIYYIGNFGLKSLSETGAITPAIGTWIMPLLLLFTFFYLIKVVK